MTPVDNFGVTMSSMFVCCMLVLSLLLAPPIMATPAASSVSQYNRDMEGFSNYERYSVAMQETVHGLQPGGLRIDSLVDVFGYPINLLWFSCLFVERCRIGIVWCYEK